MAVIGLNIVRWGSNYKKYMNSIERILEIVVIKCVKTHHMHSIPRTSPLINTTIHLNHQRRVKMAQSLNF